MEFGLWGDKAERFIKNPIEDDAFINILEGSVRSGKTVAMIPKWLNYIMTAPKGLLLMTGVSKDTIYDNVLDDFFDTLGEEHYRYNRQSGDLIVKWFDKGAECERRIKVIGAKDEGSEKFLRGKTLAGAYCDELSLMPERFFKQLLNRLSVRGAKLYGTTNPDAPFHYLYTEYITDEKKLKSGLVKVIHFELDDNPNLSEEYKTNIRASYSGMWFMRMILGLWVLAEGIIYDMFSDDLLFTDKDFTATKKSECRRYIAVDYGTTNPMAFLDIYDDGKTSYVLREYYYDSRKEHKQKTDAEYADDLEKFIGAEFPDFVIIDPSAASFKVAVRGRGFRVKDANNEVNDGIRVVSMLMSRKKLLFHESCVNLRREFQSYIWDEKAALRGEEKPVKNSDHLCVTGDTLIETPKGQLPIQTLVGKNLDVYCLDTKTGKKVAARAGNICMTQKNADVLEIETFDGAKIRLTANHPVLTLRGWVAAGDLTDKDFIAKLDRNPAPVPAPRNYDINFVRVKKITPAGKADVYNMEVENRRNYLVNGGFVLHNCDALRYFCYSIIPKWRVQQQ